MKFSIRKRNTIERKLKRIPLKQSWKEYRLCTSCNWSWSKNW